MRRDIHAVTGVLIAILLGTSACARAPKSPEAALAAARERVDQGKIGSAETIITRALAVPAFAPQRGEIFRGWIQTLTDVGRLDEARRRTLAATGDVELVRSAFDVVVRHFATNQQWTALAEWSQTLAAAPLPDEFIGQAEVWNLEASVRSGRLSSAADRVPAILQHLPELQARRIMTMMRTRLLATPEGDSYSRFLAHLQEAATRDPAWRSFLLASRISQAARDQKWDEALSIFDDLLATNDEAAVREALDVLTSDLIAAHEETRLDAWCRGVATNAAAPATTRDAAARQWMEQARRLGPPSNVVDRLGQMVAWGLPTGTQFDLLQTYFYAGMEGDRPAPAVALLRVADAIAPRLTDTNQTVILRGLLFDGAFLAEDYDRVLRELDAGISGHDADWHAMARNKVLAHRALQHGDLPEAVDRFRDFMTFVDKTWSDPEPDPTTGMRHTREMALGFNSRRIADILKQMGDQERATATYAEARQHYTKALEQARPGSPERAHIESELKRIPDAP